MGNCHGLKHKPAEPGQFSLAPSANITPAPRNFRSRYTLAGQHQVFKFVDEGMQLPTSDSCHRYFEELEALDVELVNEIFAASTGHEPPTLLQPLQQVVSCALAESAVVMQWQYAAYDAMHRKHLAVVVTATDDVTMCAVGAVSCQSPWQLLLDKLHRVRELAAAAVSTISSTVSAHEVTIPLYIVMSGRASQTAIQEHFKANRYFGLDPSSVCFVPQHCSFPYLQPEGKLLLKTSTELHTAPAGEGAVFNALHASGAISDMLHRGITYVQLLPLANLLAVPAEPNFVGFCIESGADLGLLVTEGHSESDETLSAVGQRGDGRVAELSERYYRTDEPLQLCSFGTYFYTLDFLRHKCHPRGLPKRLHVTHTQLMPVDPATGLAGDTVEPGFGDPWPTSTQALRLERRLGDVLSSAEHAVQMLVGKELSVCFLERQRVDCSSQVPTPCAESVHQARAKLSAVAVDWLQHAGATVCGEAGRDGLCQVSGRVSLQGEGLQSLQGRTFHLPLFVATSEETMMVGDCEIVVVEPCTNIRIPHPTPKVPSGCPQKLGFCGC